MSNPKNKSKEMKSFNVYGSKSESFGELHIPVWASSPVRRIPVGGVLGSDYVISGALYQAGFPVKLASKTISPFIAWEVVDFTSAVSPATEDEIVIKPLTLGGINMVPEASELIQKVGSTFTATGKAAVVASATEITTGTNKGCYTVKVLHSATIDSVTEGDFIALSAAETAGSSKSLAVIPNGYLFNDIYINDVESDIAATGAVVDMGAYILIDRTPYPNLASAIKAAIPNVGQVNG